LPHALDQQRIRLRAALVGPRKYAFVVVDRVDARSRHEFVDLDRLRRLLAERRELLGGEGDVLVLGEFVALHHVGPLDDDVLLQADVLLPQTGARRYGAAG
jgi:hypothetical protein